MMLSKKKGSWKGVAIVSLVAAHIAAGALLMSQCGNCCGNWKKMAQKAKKAVVGLVRDMM